MFKRNLFAALLAVTLFAGVGYAAAQSDTLEPATPTADVVTATPEATNVVVVPPVPTVESTVEVTPTPAPQPLFNPATIGELLLFLGLAGLAGGGIVAIVLSFLAKKEVRDRVEDARNSWSPEQQAMLANFTAGFERVTAGVLDFLKSVQDGRPNDTVVAQVLNSPQLKAGIKNGVDKALDESVGIRG